MPSTRRLRRRYTLGMLQFGWDVLRERVRPIEIEISDYDQIPGIVGEFADSIRKLGASPYKF